MHLVWGGRMRQTSLRSETMSTAELQKHVIDVMLLPTTHSWLLPAWGVSSHVDILDSPLLPDMSSHHLRCGVRLMLQIKGEAPSLRAIPPSLGEAWTAPARTVARQRVKFQCSAHRRSFRCRPTNHQVPPLAELSTATNARRLRWIQEQHQQLQKHQWQPQRR